MPTDASAKWVRENLARMDQARGTRAQALSISGPAIPRVNNYLHSSVE